MFRRSAARSVGGYHTEWFPAEDYDLWIRMLEHGRYQGLGTVELRYLENPAGVSSSGAIRQTETANRRAAEYIARWSNGPTYVESAAPFTTAPPGTWRAERAIVRSLQQAGLGIAADLRSRGIETVGLFAAPMGVSLQLLRRYPRILRQLLLLAYAPRLLVRGQFDRVHPR